MRDEKTSSGRGRSGAETREDRLKAALKANLGRRKQQARARAGSDTGGRADGQDRPTGRDPQAGAGRGPRPMREVIRPTYFTGLDLVPASLELSEFETESPRALMLRHPSPFFTRISSAIDQVADDYDIVILDSPPQLGFITMAGLYASTGLVITVHPQMIDVASMAQFMTLAGSLMEVLEAQGGRSSPLDLEKILITRHTPSDQPQMAVVTFLRSLFRSDVLAATMVNSTAVADCGLARQTLYEAVRDSSNKRTYERALQAMDGVNAELEAEVLRVWQRTTQRVEG